MTKDDILNAMARAQTMLSVAATAEGVKAAERAGLPSEEYHKAQARKYDASAAELRQALCAVLRMEDRDERWHYARRAGGKDGEGDC